jgi:hypothetical protein
MAVGNFTVYRANLEDIRINDLVGSANLRMALVTSAYTPDASNTGHALWANVSANEIANGNGYTTGGVALSSVAAATVTNGWKLTSSNPSWTASGTGIPAWRYGVIYYLGTLWGMVNPVIGYFLGDTTPADIPATSSGNPLTINVPANGWYSLTEA